MISLSPKTRLRSYYQKTLKRHTAAITAQELAENAVVFAPHQDDETLGCGATLMKKREAGAQVAVVFMTDGHQSHANFLPPEELTPMRYAEALAACQSLGIDPQAVRFLGFEDGKLDQKIAQAIPVVTALLAENQPEAIFVPYYEDVLADHVATNQIVRLALQTWGRKVKVYEYPVWFWFHWPWVHLKQNDRRMSKIAIKNTLKFRAGHRLLDDFRVSVNIAPLHTQKKAALELYRSQMERLNSNPQWAVLNDVSGGAFLNCFFQELEIYHCYHFEPVLQEKTRG